MLTDRTVNEFTRDLLERFPRIDLRNAAFVRHDDRGAIPITVFAWPDGSGVIIA